MTRSSRGIGIVTLFVGCGVVLFAACGGPTRSSEPPMAGSAAILPSPVNAEVVPKSTPSDATIPSSTNGAGKSGDLDQAQKSPAEIVVKPAASTSASASKVEEKKCKGMVPGKTKNGDACTSDKQCASCVCTTAICSRAISPDL